MSFHLRTHTILLYILFAFTLIISGCSSNSNPLPKGEKSNSHSESTKTQTKNDDIQSEVAEIKKNKTFDSKNPNFDMNIDIYQSKKNSLEMDISISNPKIYMKNVVVSAFLPKECASTLSTPDLVVSNVHLKKSFSDNSTSKAYTIGPTIQSPVSISVDRSFVLKSTTTFEEASSSIPFVLVKCSWLDEKNKEHTAFLNIKPIIVYN